MRRLRCPLQIFKSPRGQRERGGGGESVERTRLAEPPLPRRPRYADADAAQRCQPWRRCRVALARGRSAYRAASVSPNFKRSRYNVIATRLESYAILILTLFLDRRDAFRRNKTSRHRFGLSANVPLDFRRNSRTRCPSRVSIFSSYCSVVNV